MNLFSNLPSLFFINFIVRKIIVKAIYLDGGDILVALNNANIADKFTYLSIAGGTFLKWLEKGILPAVEKLKK